MYDRTRLEFEQYMANKNISDMLISGAVKITPFSDKILYEDNDGDTIPDKDDPYPDEAFDDRFEIVQDYNYEPSIDFVDERYRNSQNCHAKFDILTFPILPTEVNPMYYGKIIGALVSLSSMNNPSIPTDEIISEILGLGYDMDFGPHPERILNNRSMDNAALALLNYFSNSGIKINYPESATCEMLACSQNNLDHLHRNISRIMRCSEQVLSDNESVYLASKSNSNFKATCNVNRGADDGGLNCDIVDDDNISFHLGYDKQCNYEHRDWWNTVGESGAALVAEVSRSKDEYTINYTYYVIDIYEWAWHYDEDTLSGILHAFHESGEAQEYLMNGSFSGTIKWTKGEDAYTENVRNQINNAK